MTFKCIQRFVTTCRWNLKNKKTGGKKESLLSISSILFLKWIMTVLVCYFHIELSQLLVTHKFCNSFCHSNKFAHGIALWYKCGSLEVVATSSNVDNLYYKVNTSLFITRKLIPKRFGLDRFHNLLLYLHHLIQGSD
jgi:hypothetical protein